MRLRDFVENVQRERPEEISATVTSDLEPEPWVERRGSGKRARIRMDLGGIKYERPPSGATWTRVEEWTTPW